MTDWRQAVHYRNRAEILRTIADETDHDEYRLWLRKTAVYYDKLAAALERELRSVTA